MFGYKDKQECRVSKQLILLKFAHVSSIVSEVKIIRKNTVALFVYSGKFLNITIFKGAMSLAKVYRDNKLFTSVFLSLED